MQVRVNTFGSSFLSLNIVIAEKYLKKKELFERAFKAHSAVVKSFSSIGLVKKAANYYRATLDPYGFLFLFLSSERP